MIAQPVYASEIMTTLIAVLLLALFLAWALMAGLGNPRPVPEVEAESVWDALSRMGIEVHASPYVPKDTIYFIPKGFGPVASDLSARILLEEQRIGLQVTRPSVFVVRNVS